MKTIRGPAIFLAQFAGDTPVQPVPVIVRWAAGHGYKDVQLPSRDACLFDLARAAESRGYCDEVKGTLGRSRR
jgi:sugar phosphate isomerase/epimerase